MRSALPVEGRFPAVVRRLTMMAVSTHRWDPVAAPPRELVRPVRIDPAGATGPTRSQAAGRFWRRTSHGWYVPVDTRTDLAEQRIVEQSVRLPVGGAVTGWAGCRLHGAQFFDGLARDGRTLLPVPLAMGQRGNIRRDAAVAFSYARIEESERRLRYGIATLLPARCVVDAVRVAHDVREAVVTIDMAAVARIVSPAQVAGYAHSRAGTTRVLSALALAAEHSRSPNESRLRLIWMLDAGLPKPLVNCAIRDRSGTLLGVADLLDPEAGLVVEFDGADHRTAQQQTRDVAKDEALRNVGLEVARVTGRDLGSPSRVVARLRSARQRARFEPESSRRWRAFPPQDRVSAYFASG